MLFCFGYFVYWFVYYCQLRRLNGFIFISLFVGERSHIMFAPFCMNRTIITFMFIYIILVQMLFGEDSKPRSSNLSSWLIMSVPTSFLCGFSLIFFLSVSIRFSGSASYLHRCGCANISTLHLQSDPHLVTSCGSIPQLWCPRPFCFEMNTLQVQSWRVLLGPYLLHPFFLNISSV